MDKNTIDLKVKLLQKCIKQKDVAKKANVTVSAVCKVIAGKTISKRISQIIQEMIEEKS